MITLRRVFNVDQSNQNQMLVRLQKCFKDSVIIPKGKIYAIYIYITI